MKSCSKCGTPNREGDLFCVDCGQPLSTFAFAQTLPIRPSYREDQETQPAESGTARFDANSVLILKISDHDIPLVVRPEGVMVIGRRDKGDSSPPAIDLSAYQALEHGVSRKHARLRYYGNTLTLTDLSSRNGTYVNRKRLTPGHTCILHDGDQIMFGKLVVRVSFRQESAYGYS